MPETTSEPVDLTVTIERKHRRLPRYIVVPVETLARWNPTQTLTIEGTMNGHSLGRRSLKKWDDSRWFIDLPEPICKRAGVDVGDHVFLHFKIASEELPQELSTLIAHNHKAQRVWQSFTAGAKRMIRENIAAAKLATTRERRAVRALGLAAPKKSARVLHRHLHHHAAAAGAK